MYYIIYTIYKPHIKITTIYSNHKSPYIYKLIDMKGVLIRGRNSNMCYYNNKNIGRRKGNVCMVRYVSIYESMNIVRCKFLCIYV